MTTKRVLCYLGLHSWQRKKADGGGWYKECRRCGRFRDVPQPVLGPF